MKLVIQSPKKALKAFLRQKPLRSEIDAFKINLIALLDKINVIEKRPKDESEEHLKNDLRDFLRDTFYKDSNAINTKDKKDLVIHVGKSTDSEAGVIVEAKRPTNINEMVSPDNPNKKALHELILYYLDERNKIGNNQLKQLVITNVNEWYIIDANYFDKHIYRNNQIKKLYETKINDKKDNPFFYEEIAKIISKIEVDIPCVYFDIREYETVLRNNKKDDDKELSALFKILSPQHLLKLVTPNDSNSLNEKFYKELLHIIGLEEAKENGKKIIRRKKEYKNNASLIELTIEALITDDPFHRLPDPSFYGETKDEKVFNVSLELCITWINRILFLKLLEGQLITYHQGNKDYRFLNTETIHDFDELFKLFHRVLAVNLQDRSEAIKSKYSRVPYLNSSLFEISELEDQTIKINSLDNSEQLELISTTILKDVKKDANKLPALDYLFQFLDAYDFSSEGTEDVQEDNKTIINASVLGKVFEKINGYKDGSIFTPAFITMYMCKQSIRLAVVEKFNEILSEKKEKLFDKFDDVKNYTSRLFKTGEILKANEIINSIHICDPAVGSGHFLVSSLNEIISIKSELGILADKDGNSISGYEIEIVNDELIITDPKGNPLEYKLQAGKPISKEVQRLQKTLFYEKQTIIENCLFGVDINPNSVKICRLRLWIELLKNAYYKEETNFIELETLPNIDINIKCGNSLISRFNTKDDVFDRMPNFKNKLHDYRFWVNEYKNAKDRNLKKQLTDNIQVFTSEFKKRDPRVMPLQNLLDKKSNEYYTKFVTQKLFAERNEKIEKQKNKLENEIETLTKEIQGLKNNQVFKNAFEWRFEFPEVLNNEGVFEGFDVVIGNPPYMRVQEIEKTQPQQKTIYEQVYKSAKGSFDLANLFFELAVNISNPTASNAYIFPHKFLNADNGTSFREYLIEGKYIDKLAHFGANMVFDNADTYTCIAFYSKKKNEGIYFQRFPFKSDYKELIFDEINFKFLSYESIQNASTLYGSNNWILFDNEIGFRIFEKIFNQNSTIQNKFSRVFQGIATGKDEVYLFEGELKGNYVEGKFKADDKQRNIEIGILKPFLKGKDVHRYSPLSMGLFILFPYKIDESGKASILDENEIKDNYPNAYTWLKETEIVHRKKDNKSTNDDFWYRYARSQGINNVEILKLSSMEICANHPNVTLNFDNFYHTTKVYSWVKHEDTKEDYKYFLAIANSKLIWWFLKNTGDTLQGDARTFKTNYLNPFPLPETVSEKDQQPFIELVENIIEAKRQGKDSIENERKIDELVYQLYGLTEEEIKIVENN